MKLSHIDVLQSRSKVKFGFMHKVCLRLLKFLLYDDSGGKNKKAIGYVGRQGVTPELVMDLYKVILFLENILLKKFFLIISS